MSIGPWRQGFQRLRQIFVRIFSPLYQRLPRCSQPFSRTIGNLIPFSQDNSRVASSDLLDFAPSQDIWALGHTPINVETLKKLLKDYPNTSDAAFLAEGFEFGFKLHYDGPRHSVDSKNLKSVLQNEDLAKEKLDQEIALGRMAGPFPYKPISNLRCSPIGLVPKKTGGFRLITHLSYPAGFSVNDGIDDAFASVRYSNFDNAVAMIKKVGKGALLGKLDVKSAFRLLRIYPGDFSLLGIKLGEFYYIDKMAPMGLKISCAAWEAFAKFLNWCIKQRSASNKECENTDCDHYLDDYIFAGPCHSGSCLSLMKQFLALCHELNVPIASEKTVWPCTCLTYLGYQLNSLTFEIKMPEEKVRNLLCIIESTLARKRIKLKEMQSLTGSLAFCAKAMPSARAFIRRMYASMSGVSKPYHHIRLSKGIKEDLKMWQQFLSKFN
ncbi:MAG: reverse transcriptase domain-containing protein, partial [Candidatus Thiodiazotropha sp.]